MENNNNKNNVELGNVLSSVLAETNLMLVKRDKAELLIEHVQELQETYGTSAELNVLRMKLFDALGIDDNECKWNFAKRCVNPFRINHVKCLYCGEKMHVEKTGDDGKGKIYCDKCYEKYIINKK